MTARLGFAYTGSHPRCDWCTVLPTTPAMRGIDGPHMSTSRRPTSYPREDRACATWVDTVLLPTPPLPLSTSTTWDTSDSELRRTARSPSLAASAAGDENAPDEQAVWFGQPAHADAFPASEEVGPTHPSLASEGASPPVEEDIVLFYSSSLSLEFTIL